MLENCIVVLGSGLSINNLTDKEREMINACPVKISINKYAAFFDLAGIAPTHIFFTDDYYESSILFFQYLVETLKRKKLNDLTQLLLNQNKSSMIL